ncbi:MAG: hypothetical protein M3010_11755, partial [Candidatus Dormibacteraeota bacterium]|nr:hypothetical protein [Candidatus Dormibacteraeota bacterium]
MSQPAGARYRANDLRSLDVQRLLFMVFVGVVFVALARPLIDTDLWWHLANGRLILAHGVPSRDVYSHTAVGHVWVVHEWLSDVVFYLLYQAGGIRALLLLSAAAVAAGMYLVYRLLRAGGLGNNSAVLISMALLVAASPSFGPRPQVLNFVLSAVLLVFLLSYRRRPDRRGWWLLPYFLLWANLHSGYVVGVGLLAVYVLGEAVQASSRRLGSLRQEGVPLLPRAALRRLAVMVPLGLLSGVVTPATWRTLVFALGTLSSSSIQSFITEWSSPDFHQPWGMALMVVILLMVGGLVAARGAGADPTVVLLGLVGVTLGLTSQRHVPIFAVAAAPLVGHSVSGLLATLGFKPRPPRSPAAAVARINAVILVVLVVGGGVFMSLNLSSRSIDIAVAAAEPVAATDWLRVHRPPRQLFNEYKYGGWLIWKAPDYPVFIDGRVEVYGDAVFNEYLRTEYLTDSWQEPLDRYRVKTILVTSGDR